MDIDDKTHLNDSSASEAESFRNSRGFKLFMRQTYNPTEGMNLTLLWLYNGVTEYLKEHFHLGSDVGQLMAAKDYVAEMCGLIAEDLRRKGIAIPEDWHAAALQKNGEVQTAFVELESLTQEEMMQPAEQCEGLRKSQSNIQSISNTEQKKEKKQ